MKTLTQTNSSLVRNVVATSLLAAGIASVSLQTAQAEPLKDNTIYVTTNTGLYEIDESNGISTFVGSANVGISQVEDMAFANGELYGLTYLMQFTKYNTDTSTMTELNDYTSYASHHQGFEYSNGVFYAASNYGLERVDPEAGTFTYIGSYGLGASEEVTDLAVSYDGNLYATVDFGIGYDYLATVDVNTGEMTLIGSLLAGGTRGLTEKNGELYMINNAGFLYAVNKTSGVATLINETGILGVIGMETTSSNDLNGSSNSDNDSNGSSGGSMSIHLLMMALMIVALRKLQGKR